MDPAWPNYNKYFTNLDFPEIFGVPCPFRKRYLLGAQKSLVFSVVLQKHLQGPHAYAWLPWVIGRSW